MVMPASPSAVSTTCHRALHTLYEMGLVTNKTVNCH